MTPSPTSKAGSLPNKRLPDADPIHAYVEDGVLYVMSGGYFWQHSQSEAFWEWFRANSSPYPEVQERARQIRAAMDEAYPERMVA